MAKQTICYRSDAGNDFPTEFEALKDDLRFYIFNVIKNEATAKQLAEAMVSDLGPTCDWVAYEALPPSPVPAPPHPVEIISPGMAVLFERLCSTQPRIAVPDHVSWNGKRFVCTLSQDDKGDDFFNRWYQRKGEFPPPEDRLKIGHHVEKQSNGQWAVFYGEGFVCDGFVTEQDAKQHAMSLDATAL